MLGYDLSPEADAMARMFERGEAELNCRTVLSSCEDGRQDKGQIQWCLKLRDDGSYLWHRNTSVETGSDEDYERDDYESGRFSSKFIGSDRFLITTTNQTHWVKGRHLFGNKAADESHSEAEMPGPLAGKTMFHDLPFSNTLVVKPVSKGKIVCEAGCDGDC